MIIGDTIFESNCMFYDALSNFFFNFTILHYSIFHFENTDSVSSFVPLVTSHTSTWTWRDSSGSHLEAFSLRTRSQSQEEP